MQPSLSTAKTDGDWSFVAHEPIGGGVQGSTCVWQSSYMDHMGLAMTSNTWGNYPGDHTLMGCNAVYIAREYTEFVAEAELVIEDDDGVGFVFGWRGENDHHMAIAINDIWPSPAADGVGGPFIKVKRRNSRTCTGSMDAVNNCFDTLGYTDSTGTYPAALPDGYAPSYGRFPCSKQTHCSFPTATAFKMTLIVRGGEARCFFEVGGGHML